VHAQDKFIVMASTTSTEQSGLFGHLLPAFKAASGIDVRVVALGTGQALDTGRRGDADVVFVHDTVAERSSSPKASRHQAPPVMYNDFVLIGPASDPAKVKGNDIAAALKKLADAERKLRLARRQERHPRRRAALLEGRRHRHRRRQAGRLQGMRLRHGPGTEHGGSSTNAYVLTDRGTWLSFKNRGDLAVLVEGDKRLFNQYGVMVVNPAKHPHVKAALAQAFADWVVSPPARPRSPRTRSAASSCSSRTLPSDTPRAQRALLHWHKP
jgi:tungstate transport system substrate-binding protein